MHLNNNLTKAINFNKLNINILRLSYSFSCPIDNRVHRPDLIPINFCMDAINKNEIVSNTNIIS